ncbi:hypothetical protein N5P37_002395 [Trichoderma harzianum]|uniref:Uncharacterized protein n=1 Tax=Trichoderma harzianum CBS 226.95 TaxID=983964 RepID=A0A2T4AFR6_TRIHA|nr:hypothetical protein M431DRAFT_4707 [Trichoderma harzianum CBS 226.95]KAK0764923.1 hypothetical protein N5P37_002395 [Trichoderma harzianum]PKK41786.1 hypothetical protein CI102_13744 [Trichoderma harzianum]PTB55758.1 hypothetical protein M431DRAFT_4707 [Trichoderma harzianum CBS 226.95]
MASQADRIYQLEQQLEKETLTGITNALLLISGQKVNGVPVTPVTKPSIRTASWVYERSGLGAKIIQEPASQGYVSWREYEPNGRDRVPIVIHYSAKMNGETRDWKFQLAIHDPDQFWKYLQHNGDPTTDIEEYEKLLATLWSQTYKISFKPKRLPISMKITKIETVNFPKANK